MKKRKLAVLTAFMIGISCCAQEMVTLAAQEAGDTDLLGAVRIKEPQENIDFFHIKEKGWNRDSSNLLDMEETETLQESFHAEEDVQKEPDKDILSEMNNLQIPQRLGVVIDPWEMDGKGQIYSEQYLIKNTGQSRGTLTLSELACKPQAQSEAIIQNSSAGLHDNEEKSIYIQMVFGNGDRVVLSEEEAFYQADLQPGEEISVCFTGEVNEYASESWKEDDIEVNVVYSWEAKETAAGMETEEETAKDGSAIPKDETEENGEADAGTDAKSDEEETADDADKDQSLITEEDEDSRIFELQGTTKEELLIDSWELDENGNSRSVLYTLKNTGDNSGILEWSELLCEPKEENKAVYMELVMESGERLVFSRTDKELLESKLELAPGEEVSFYLVGEWNGNDRKTAVSYSWTVEETVSE